MARRSSDAKLSMSQLRQSLHKGRKDHQFTETGESSHKGQHLHPSADNDNESEVNGDPEDDGEPEDDAEGDAQHKPKPTTEVDNRIMPGSTAVQKPGKGKGKAVARARSSTDMSPAPQLRVPEYHLAQDVAPLISRAIQEYTGTPPAPSWPTSAKSHQQLKAFHDAEELLRSSGSKM
ncbi:hypothetical protein B0I35DRAFT_460267 [Stachybotrys elegans]|uniref:Uncharacterized protein n=1 Tax=Stachybotrys elegans TaxID=80388 RepID=A0A8K0SNK5_9HYPO|nr:hypothetical protein B0I35DRAFT_460267 [Stachybotrys elegans]